MPVPRSVFEQVNEFEQQGYRPSEILDGLERSPQYSDLGRQVRSFRLTGRGDDEILAGLKESYVPEPPGLLERAGGKASEILAGTPGASAAEAVQSVAKSFQPGEVGRSLVGAGETTASLLTSLYGLPLSGLAGLGALPFGGFEGAQRAIEETQKYTIYQPQTERGRQIAGVAFWPFEKLHELGGAAGEKTLEATGSPGLATAAATAVEMAPFGLSPALKAVRGRGAAPLPKQGAYAGPGAGPYSERASVVEMYSAKPRPAPVVEAEVVGETVNPRIPPPPPRLEAPRPALPEPPPAPPPPLEQINLPVVYSGKATPASAGPAQTGSTPAPSLLPQPYAKPLERRAYPSIPVTVPSKSPWELEGQNKSPLRLRPRDEFWMIESTLRDQPRPSEATGPQTVVLTGGPPGAGKSSGTRELGIDRRRFVVADADEMKRKSGWDAGEDASAFHEQSSTVNKKLRDLAIDRGYSTIYDSLMSNYEEAKSTINKAREKGAKVNLVFTDIDAGTSQARSMMRNMLIDRESGAPLSIRKIPVETSIKGHNNSAATFRALFDEFRGDPRVDMVLMDNNVDLAAPRLVFKQEAGKITVGDQALFDSFLGMKYHNVGKGGEIRYERSNPVRDLEAFGGLESLQQRALEAARAVAARSGGRLVADSGGLAGGKVPLGPRAGESGNLQGQLAARLPSAPDRQPQAELTATPVPPAQPVAPQIQPQKVRNLYPEGIPPERAKRALRRSARIKIDKTNTLRGAINKMGGINPGNFKGEFKEAPVAVKFLLKKSGEHLDLAEARLREEGWLRPDENLIDVLRDPASLRRNKVAAEGASKQERFKTEVEKRFEREMAWEPEEPPPGEYVTLEAEDLPKGRKLTLIDDSAAGWDVYEVVEKDPFGVVLQDGKTINLSPGQRVQVRKQDIVKPAAGEGVDAATGLSDNEGVWNEIHEPKAAYRQLQLDFSAPAKPRGPAGTAQGHSLPADLQARVRTGMATTGSLRAGSLYARGPAEAASLLAHIRKSPQENLYLVAVDEAGKILEIHRYSKGTKSAAYAHPVEMIGSVMNVPGTKRVFVAHNHPGGSALASREDIALLEHIEAGLKLADIETIPIIIAGTKWKTFSPVGDEVGIPPAVRKVDLPIKERVFAMQRPGERASFPQEAVRIKNELYGRDSEGFMLLDNKLRVSGFLEHKPGRPMAEVAADLIRSAEKTNAAGYLFFSNEPIKGGGSRERFLTQMKTATAENLQLFDVFVKGESAPLNAAVKESSAAGYKNLKSGGTLYSGIPIPAIIDFLTSTKVKGFFDPFHNLPQKEAYLESRYKSFGGIARVEKIVERVFERTKGLDEQTRADLFRYLDGQAVQLPPEVQRLVDTLKIVNNTVGKMLVNRGLLSPEAFEAHKNQYVRYLYLKHVLGDKFNITGRGGRMDLTYLKHRKDLTDEQRKAIGLVEDVSVAEPYGLSKSLSDIVKHDFYEQIAGNSEWVWEPSVIEAGEIRRFPDIASAYRMVARHARAGDPVQVRRLPNGQFFLERTAGGEPVRHKIGLARARAELEAQRRVARESQAPEVLDRLQRLEKAVSDAEAQAGKLTADFVEMPDSPNYGPLAGAYVRKEIARDVVPFIGRIPDKVHASASLNTVISAFEAGMTAFKVSKTALNLPTAARNIYSNFVQLNMSGIPWYEIPGYMAKAANEMRTKGRLYGEAFRNGLTKTNWTEAEIGEVLSAFKQMQGGGLETVVSKLRDVAKYYGKIDDFFKLAKFIEQRESGASVGKAIREAQKWGMDYSIADPSVRMARRFAAPFLSYPYKVTPLIAEAIQKRPWVIAKYLALPYAMFEAAKYALDLTEEDFKRLKKLLPEYVRKNPTYAVLPWKSPEGNLQWVNLGYYFPWSTHVELARGVASGKPESMVQLIGNPYLDMLWSLKSGKGDDPPRDSFTGREIYNRLDSPAEKALKLSEWLYNKWAPTMLTREGAAGYTARAVTGEKDRYGRKVTPEQAVGRWMGVNIVSPTPMQAAVEKRAKISDLKAALYRALRDPNLKPAEKAELMNRFGAELKEVGE